RYHVHILKTPTEVRRALAYVLTNEARHSHGLAAGTLKVRLDPFSSARAFRGWKKLLGNRVQFSISNWSEDWIEAWHSEVLSPARTWLLQEGWAFGKKA